MVEKSKKSIPESGRPEKRLIGAKGKDAVKASRLIADQLINDSRFKKGLFGSFGVQIFQDSHKKFYAATVHLTETPDDETAAMLPTSIIIKKKKTSYLVPVIYSVAGQYIIKDDVSQAQE